MPKFKLGANYCKIVDQTPILIDLENYFDISDDEFQEIFNGYKQNQQRENPLNTKHILTYGFFLHVCLKVRDLKQRNNSINNRIQIDNDYITIDCTNFLIIENILKYHSLCREDLEKLIAEYFVVSSNNSIMNTGELSDHFVEYLNCAAKNLRNAYDSPDTYVDFNA